MAKREVDYNRTHWKILSTDSKVTTILCCVIKQYDRKVLLSSFYFNGHILGFNPQFHSKNYSGHPLSRLNNCAKKSKSCSEQGEFEIAYSRSLTISAKGKEV